MTAEQDSSLVTAALKQPKRIDPNKSDILRASFLAIPNPRPKSSGALLGTPVLIQLK